MKYGMVSVCTGLVCACAATSASGALLGFEDLAATTKVYPYGFGTSFVTAGMTVSVAEYRPGKNGGVEASDAIITLGTTNYAGMSGNALAMKEALATFTLGTDIVGIDFYLGEFGKESTLEINGATFQAVDLNTLPALLGGTALTYTQLTATPDGKGSFAHISISGAISSFSIGGRKLWIDDLSFTAIPTPGTASLIVLGGLIAIRRKR